MPYTYNLYNIVHQLLLPKRKERFYQILKDTEEPLNAYYQVKETSLNRLHTMFHYMTFWKRHNDGDS